MNDQKFYDNHYTKFGRYDFSTHAECELNLNKPEDLFKQLIINQANKNSLLVDLGCGDGGFTTSLLKYYKKIIGIEPSQLINEAIKYKTSIKSDKLVFLNEDAKNTSITNESADVVISRRGPNPIDEIKRILKKSGIFIFITIGETDASTLKNKIGRGQMYGEETSVSLEISKSFEDAGFQTIQVKDFKYDEHYSSFEQLRDFLKMVPIFEDFSDADYPVLVEYCREHTCEQNIILNRHRVVFSAIKLPNL